MSNLAEFVQKLDCPDEADRIYAAEDIGYLNIPAGMAPLLAQLSKEPSRAVHDAIFQALTRIDADAAIEGAILLLESEDPHIRNQAVDVLRRKGLRSIPFLRTAMRHGDKDMRKLVLDVLSGLQAGEAEDIYAAALSDTDVNVVITAVENLGRIRAGAFRSQIESLLRANSHPMLAAACLEALVGIGHASSLETIRGCFPHLAALPDFFLASCLKAMAALGSDREFIEVANLLLVRSPNVRPAILGALVAICTRCPLPDLQEEWLRALMAVVEDGDQPLCCYQAVRVLGFWATRDDVQQLLVSCLCSPERLVRLGAAEALRTAQRPDILHILASRVLEESDEEVLQALSC